MVLVAAALTLVLTDVQKLPLDLRVLERSVATALDDSGLVLSWERTAPGAGRDARPEEVRVILLGTHPRSGKELVLGSVLRGDSNVRAAWVYVQAIHRVLEAGRSGSSNRLQLSIAVGRVIAHEVAHVVAPAQPHSGEGLMGRSVDRRILLEDAPLDADARSAIRSALASGLGPALSGPEPGAFSGVSSGIDFVAGGISR